jgi:hypothetical protein
LPDRTAQSQRLPVRPVCLFSQTLLFQQQTEVHQAIRLKAHGTDRPSLGQRLLQTRPRIMVVTKPAESVPENVESIGFAKWIVDCAPHSQRIFKMHPRCSKVTQIRKEGPQIGQGESFSSSVPNTTVSRQSLL